MREGKERTRREKQRMMPVDNILLPMLWCFSKCASLVVLGLDGKYARCCGDTEDVHLPDKFLHCNRGA